MVALAEGIQLNLVVSAVAEGIQLDLAVSALAAGGSNWIWLCLL